MNRLQVTLIGKNNPPYTGKERIPEGYYLDIEKKDGLYYAKLKHDVIPPLIKLEEDIGKMTIGIGTDVELIINIIEEGSRLNTNEFTIDDLIFEVNGNKVTPQVSRLSYINKVGKGTYRYILNFRGIEQSGNLVIRVEANKVYDIAKLGNVATVLVDANIIVDNEGPNIGGAKLELIEPKDGVTETGDFEVKIEGVEDDDIGGYEWEIRNR